MSTLRERIDAELENLETSILLLPPASELPYKSVLEQAGVAGLLHSFYNGIENILKQIMVDRGVVFQKSKFALSAICCDGPEL